VQAKVVGSRGSTTVTGPQLRSRLGLYDTWAYFVQIKSEQGGTTKPTATDEKPADGGEVTEGGGTTAQASWLRRIVGPRQLIVSGSVSPKPKKVTLQKRSGKRWKTVGYGQTDARGRYALLVDSSGAYRVLAGGAVGPITHIR
jgi:stage II sporulation protein D